MKFKKSISFALTLCMVLSLFATFVIPASAAEKAVTATVTDGSVKILTEKLALLCDGNDAASATAFSDAGLVAFENTGFTHTDGVDAAVPATIEFVLDLGEATGISGAYMTFFRDDASMVALPSGVVFEGSVDGKYWYNLNAGGTVAPSADDKTVATAKADFSTRAVYEVRYVKATATFKNGWIFAGELGVLAAGTSGVGAIAPDYAFAYTADSTPSSNCIGIFGAGTYDLATSEEGKYLKSGQLLIAKEVADGVYVTSMNKVNAWPDGHSGEVTIAEDEILVSIVTGGALANNETDYYTTAKWIARGLPNEGTVIVVDKEASTVAFYPANYEVPEAVVTSKVVTDWNPVSYKESVGGATGAFIYDDADIYANSGNNWWIHVSFAPSAAVEGYYDVVAVRAPSEGAYLDIPEGGFVWMAWSSAGDTPESSGAYALAFMNNLKVGDVVSFKGVDFVNKTTTADATAEVWIDPNAPVNIALNKDYTLSGEENATYNAKLTDGVAYAAMAYNNSWFAFTGANTVDKIGTVVIDLGALYNVNSIKVNMVNDFGAGVAVPEYAKLYVSEDGETWVEAGSLTFVTTDLTAYWTEINDLDLDAQYVKYEVKLGGTFAFLNEIEVYGAEVAEEEPEPGVEIVLPEGTGITIPDGYGATDILLDGYTGVGEITAHDGNHDKLVCLRNGTTDVESEYTLKVTLDKETAFNVVTLYILSHTGGNVGLPKAVTVNINGVDYEAAIAGEDASVVAIEVKLEEAVSATGFTVDVVMNSGNVKYNMYSEIAVSLVEDEPEAPVTSQVVTDWNVSDWSTSANGANGAYLFTDQDAYLSCTHTWWSHISFKPTTIAGVYEVAAIRGATGEAASFEIAEGGFVLAAHDTAAAGTAGAYVHALIKSLEVGDRVIFNGLNIADLTTTADATAVLVPTAEDMDLIVSHNYNYSWHCFETQIITMAVGEANLKKAGDAPNMSAEDTDILYIVELVDGAYKVTGVVGGKALLDVEIPENGFLYYVTKNCTGYDKICHGELVGKYLLLGDIDLATKFAIDPKVNPAYTMKAVSGFKTGDADLDGKITATDYAIVRKLVLGTLTAEDVGELAYKAADVNGNGKVDARDYYLVKRAFLGTYVIPGWEENDAE